MNNINLQVEQELLAVLILAVEQQKRMVESKNRGNITYLFNNWLNLGNRILNKMGIDSNSFSENYYSVYTDTLHDQLNEIRKTIKTTKTDKK